jgi:hypothetical protein
VAGQAQRPGEVEPDWVWSWKRGCGEPIQIQSAFLTIKGHRRKDRQPRGRRKPAEDFPTLGLSDTMLEFFREPEVSRMKANESEGNS